MIKEAIKQNRKLFIRFFVSFAVTCILGALLCITASALSPDPETETQVLAANPEAEPVDESLLKQLIGIDGSQTLEVILIVTILSIAPSFLVMLTSFTRIVIVFSFLRNAMQTQSIPPNAVLMGLSLFLTVFIMWPTITDINENAYQPYSAGEIGINEMIDRSAESLKTFMLKNTSKSNMKFFLDLKGTVVYEAEQRSEAAAETEENSDFITPLEPLEPITDITERTPVDIEQTPNELTDYTDQLGLETVIPAFILSELTRAFQMGFLIFIPFLVIDIVVSSTLMAMGMMMLPPSMISLPFKIMLFVLVDGWQMLIGTLVNSFNI
ncbi:MAG TPA: flagellar biosynthetic protein FliP [Ruminococcaceae bacterium]|nr:flagellar biosynthetic protein FliP [Oscillospiraceae bacterium]